MVVIRRVVVSYDGGWLMDDGWWWSSWSSWSSWWSWWSWRWMMMMMMVMVMVMVMVDDHDHDHDDGWWWMEDLGLAWLGFSTVSSQMRTWSISRFFRSDKMGIGDRIREYSAFKKNNVILRRNYDFQAHCQFSSKLWFKDENAKSVISRRNYEFGEEIRFSSKLSF